MRKPSDTPSASLHKGQDKIKPSKPQILTIFEYLKEHVATASMITEATGIPQKNICRYKRDLEKEGRLWEVEKKPCQKTGRKAWHLTTDPQKAVTKSHN